ncbi:MAG TPA: glutathione S-transferase N-terminal domain-containing protein [Methylophilus sp.]|nr:glutathione S-transferase N-terminal domain-containing protein [Methylophilus sp.]HQQ33091.1 glutathione S-transferase N-terminal domain-containing protein [Methylophilus sp.]
MKLLYTPNSPYARKVRIVAMEKHIELEMQEVVLSDPDNPVKQYNPLGKIPVLVLDDGDSLYDSPVICEYLDHRAPVARLIPAENNFRIDVLRWQALADGVCDAAVAVMLEQRKPEEQQSKANIEKQLSKVIAGLEVMDRDITKKKWCVDETFSLADIALGCALGYVDLRLKDLHWQDRYTNLAKHYSILTKRPSFKETAPV